MEGMAGTATAAVTELQPATVSGTMGSNMTTALRLGTAALLLIFAASAAATPVTPATQPLTLDGMTIYVGVLPAAMITGHAPEHPEETMHGGVPGGSHQFHLVVTLFDAASGARITGAQVKARVAELGLAGTEQVLEPMAIADTETYGGYFRLAGDNPFRIALEIRRSDGGQVTRAEFEYRQPWVAR